MRNPTYRYNAETCRYERTKRSWVSVFLYSSGLLLSALFMLCGLLLLHDFLFDSENEKRFRSENLALKKNQILLTDKLEVVEATMVSLHEKDQILHRKFFATDLPS